MCRTFPSTRGWSSPEPEAVGVTEAFLQTGEVAEWEDSIWRTGPKCLEVPTGVDVWQGSLARDAAEFAALARLLDPAERERAARFVFPCHRARFIAGRGLLRLVLSRYLGPSPESLVFEYGNHGKPALRSICAPPSPPLSFNLSHSDDLLVIAVANGRQVGVDIERVRESDEEGLDTAEIAERFFSSLERRALAQLAPADRRRGFFSCWTRKEAFIKALGRGLSVPLDAFDVSVDPDGPARLLDHRLSHEAVAASWSLHTLPAAPRFSATLAVAPALTSPRDVLRLWRC